MGLLNPEYNSIDSSIWSVARLSGFKPVAWKQMLYKLRMCLELREAEVLEEKYLNIKPKIIITSHV